MGKTYFDFLVAAHEFHFEYGIVIVADNGKIVGAGHLRGCLIIYIFVPDQKKKENFCCDFYAEKTKTM